MKPKSRNHRTRTDLPAPDGAGWIWGSHAVRAALDNPAREVKHLIATRNALQRLALEGAEIVSARDIAAALPPGAVHQGVAASVVSLPGETLDEILARRPDRLAVLDQIADPQNLGAVFRSAAAFSISGLVLQTRHSPPLTASVAKVAAGGIEQVSEVRVVNIARALDALNAAGYATIGLDAAGTTDLRTALNTGPPCALVLGAEGAGLRPAVAKACTHLAHIPIAPAMESLNLSNAAAIAFYLAAEGTFTKR
jgi:23S rRNA (guanosine2251-2'-O)-methyltransferase